MRNGFEEPDEPAASPRWTGIVTPLRVLLFLVWLGAGAATAFGVIVARSLPMTASALAVWGVTFFLFGLIAVAAAVRAGSRSEGGTAVFAALFGGLCMFGASGALTLAIVIGLL